MLGIFIFYGLIDDWSMTMGATSSDSLLLQAQGEPEVFVIIDGTKHWIQNPKTAQILGYDLSKRKIVTLDELNEYPTGDTLNRDPNDPTHQPKDIYLIQQIKANPFMGLRGLITLNPRPEDGKIVEDLGFNVIMPYSGTVSGWRGGG